jgi:predicted aminopeptidase
VVRQLVDQYRSRLADVYAQPLQLSEMRARKQHTLAEMRADYEGLKEGWGGFNGYDWWFAQPLNNAQLASVSIYTQLVPVFERILREDGGDLPRFYAEVKRLALLSREERDAALARFQG